MHPQLSIHCGTTVQRRPVILPPRMPFAKAAATAFGLVVILDHGRNAAAVPDAGSER